MMKKVKVFCMEKMFQSEVEFSCFKNLVNEYIEDFKSKSSNSHLGDYIIKESIPVIWFGNLNDYLKSKTRIVTVGLNPSNKEFPENNRWLRFDYVDLYSSDCNQTIFRLVQTLNSYFDKNPYWKWFGRGEKVLEHLGASYRPSKIKNQAIHIDIYSAIATTITWSNLDPEVMEKIRIPIIQFKKLLAFLRPDIILISTNKKVFSEVFNDDFTKDYENPNGNKFRYVRKYHNDGQLLYWISNYRGTAFAPSLEFIKKSIDVSY